MVSSKSTTKSSRKSSGFTIMELLVSIGIMMFIIGVIAFSQSHYSDAANLNNVVEELSSTLSQAQVYGNSVKEFQPGSSQFNYGYGVSIDLDNPDGYNLYIDKDGNGFYNNASNCPIGGASECLQRVTLPKGFTITDICFVGDDEGRGCGRPIDVADIYFKRPSLQPNMIFIHNGGQVNAPQIIGLRIEVTSLKGLKKYVDVKTSGQIGVE